MVGHNMNGPTRDQVLKFMEEKEKIEREIQELNIVLETNVNVGMNEPLVDANGYPRNDIDVYRVRHARHRIIRLQNDHKEIMKQIEKGIQAVHEEFVGPHGEGTSHSGLHNGQPMDTSYSNSNGHANENGYALTNGYQNGIDEDAHVAVMVRATNNLSVTDRAFAKINFINEGSPSFNAGLRVDDEILEFGSVNATNYRHLRQIGDIVRCSFRQRVNVRLRRGTEILNVALVPDSWEGSGHLGCNIVSI